MSPVICDFHNLDPDRVKMAGSATLLEWTVFSPQKFFSKVVKKAGIPPPPPQTAFAPLPSLQDFPPPPPTPTPLLKKFPRRISSSNKTVNKKKALLHLWCFRGKIFVEMNIKSWIFAKFREKRKFVYANALFRARLKSCYTIKDSVKKLYDFLATQ